PRTITTSAGVRSSTRPTCHTRTPVPPTTNAPTSTTPTTSRRRKRGPDLGPSDGTRTPSMFPEDRLWPATTHAKRGTLALGTDSDARRHPRFRPVVHIDHHHPQIGVDATHGGTSAAFLKP